MPGEELPDPPIPAPGTYGIDAYDRPRSGVAARATRRGATRTVAPSRPPTFAPGDRVIITGSGMAPPSTVGKYGTVTGPAVPHSWFRAAELEPLPAEPTPTTRTLLISLPLEPDAERPHSVTELIDLIAENWETVGWGFHDT